MTHCFSLMASGGQYTHHFPPLMDRLWNLPRKIVFVTSLCVFKATANVFTQMLWMLLCRLGYQTPLANLALGFLFSTRLSRQSSEWIQYKLEVVREHCSSRSKL